MPQALLARDSSWREQWERGLLPRKASCPWEYENIPFVLRNIYEPRCMTYPRGAYHFHTPIFFLLMYELLTSFGLAVPIRYCCSSWGRVTVPGEVLQSPKDSLHAGYSKENIHVSLYVHEYPWGSSMCVQFCYRLCLHVLLFCFILR